MCDGLGRQFSYTCPNTTLFQQRMLICDHWYMVNCSKAEKDYDANLLIGEFIQIDRINGNISVGFYSFLQANETNRLFEMTNMMCEHQDLIY